MNPRFFLLLALCIPVTSLAETVYIKDVFYAPLRSGPTAGHRVIHAGIPSGTRLEKTETSGDFSKVTLDTGKSGWLRSDYLTTEIIAREKLKQAEEKIRLLSQGNTPLLEQLNTLEQQHQELQQQFSAVSTERDQLKQELEKLMTVSSKPMEIAATNEQLLRDKEQITNELDILRAENSHLKTSSERETMVNTLMAVAFGVLLALVLPMLKPRKRPGDDWS